jgi:hypothetical protein
LFSLSLWPPKLPYGTGAAAKTNRGTRWRNFFSFVESSEPNRTDKVGVKKKKVILLSFLAVASYIFSARQSLLMILSPDIK